MDTQHLQVINRVLDYIQGHISDPLTITDLSKVACYSEYHFQRVFKSHVGETVQKYVHRKRLERAAELLRSQREMTITEVALSSGFANSASFAKAFKAQFNMNATQWRDSHAGLINTKERADFQLTLSEGRPLWQWTEDDNRLFSDLSPSVHLESLPELRIAYVRNVGQYMANETLFFELYQKLFQWAGSHNALNENTQTYNFYTDSPDITQGEKLQVLASITVDESVKPKGSIGIKSMAGGLYAVTRFKLNNDTFKLAWQWIYERWLPQSGFTIDDRAAFERSAGKTETPGEYIVDIGVPVK